MYPYIILLVVFFLVCALISIGSFKHKKKITIISGTILISLFSGLRAYTVGWDTLNYCNIFATAKYYTITDLLEKNLELGYVLLCKFLALFSSEYTVLLLTTSVLTQVLVAKYIYDNSDRCVLSQFLYITIFSMNFTMSGIRQGLAMAWVALGISELLKGNAKKFVVLILIATLFHNSAFIFLVFYFLPKFNPKIKNMMIIVGVTLLTIPSFTILFDLFIAIFPRFSIYKGSSYFQGSEIGKQDIIFGFMFLILFLILIYLMKQEKDINKKKQLFILAYAMFLGVMAIGFTSQISIIERIVRYFNVFVVIVIPRIIDYLKQGKKIAYLSIYSFFLVIYMYILSMGTYGGIPYVLSFGMKL